jgi:hypothetical protein
MAKHSSQTSFRASAAAHALAVSVLGLSALAAVAACVAARAPADSELAGNWQLDPTVSDNVETQVTQAVNKAEEKERQRRRRLVGGAGEADGGGSRSRRGGSGPAGSGAGNDTGSETNEPPQVVAIPFLGPDFGQLRTHLLQILGAPPILSLSVGEVSVTIQSDHLPARDYQPGESFVRVDEYGNANVSSGWSGQAFVVRERYTSRAALTERYEFDPKAGTLIYTRELKDPAVGSIELKSVYHRA